MSEVGAKLMRVAGVVAIATALSKVIGLVRQLLIASMLGSGAEYSAFAVAYILPGFLLILLGGINGPFHSAIVSILKKRQGLDNAAWIETISTLVSVVLAVVTLGLILGATPLVSFLAPGASDEIKVLAAAQLRLMAPLALLSGWIGIGFGTLNAADRYLLPALSPLMSSLAVIIALLAFGEGRGPLVLAGGVLAGGVAQWIVQVPVQSRLGLGRLRWRWDWRLPEVKLVAGLMIPAVISSGMIHINVYTDIFFASFIPGDRTIGNLAYAQLLYLTPLGILSNMILVPLMPLYSRLAVPEHYGELRVRIRQGLVATAMLILPAAMLLGTLAQPLVRLVYERGAFSAAATAEVAALLVAYAVGMLFYLGRDVVVRIFYALEDSRTPLRISVVAIALNALFDWVGIQWLGAPGLALATAAVNGIALVWLFVLLQQRLGELPWPGLLLSLGQLLALTAIAGVVTRGCWWGSQALWGAAPPLLQLVQLGGAASLGVLVFGVGLWQLGLPETEILNQQGDRLWQRLRGILPR